MNDKKYSDLIIGQIILIILSGLLRIVKIYFLKKSNFFSGFPWMNKLGILLFIFAMIFFIYERWKEVPFVYGKSQHGGTNSNSFMIFAVSLYFFEFNSLQFLGALVGTCILNILIFGVINYIKSIEIN